MIRVSLEEVRQKPEADSPIEAAPDNCNSYYDILVLGRTGMGKSTTVDKLIAATTKNHTEQREAPESKDGKEPKTESTQMEKHNCYKMNCSIRT